MNLSFQTKWGKEMGKLAGQPTLFIPKIWGSICHVIGNRDDYDEWYDKVEARGIDLNVSVAPKHHTIRHDPVNRWKPGMDIHFVINNRTKERFQFAPTIPVVSVQVIEIIYDSANQLTEGFGFRIGSDLCAIVLIDRHIQKVEEIITLSKNDGFPHVDDFFMFFNKNFTGKIIHWTNLKY